MASSGGSTESAPSSNSTRSKVVVVGGGFAGFGAAYHLAKQGCYDVTLLDVAPNPGGLSTGWRTPQGRAVEAGTKGFWYSYHNIFALVRELGVSPWPFTPWTRTGFWMPKGLVTQSPVFSDLPRLPTLLGQFIHTADLFTDLPLTDRLSLWRLAGPLLDCLSNTAAYESYDRMSAYELFRSHGVSERLYTGFLRPLLLVLLFAPPEELSAAAVMSAMYYLVMGHQNDFDVAWCRGSVSERIFTPLVAAIKEAGGDIRGGCLVTGIELTGIELTDGHGLSSPTNGDGPASATDSGRRVAAVRCRTVIQGGGGAGGGGRSQQGEEEVYEADAVVIAVSVKGMQKLVCGCDALAEREEFRKVMDLRSVDVMSTRLWFDRRFPTRFASNCIAGFDEAVGGTFFNLNELQDEYRDEAGSVIGVDLYHCGSLLPLSDEQVVSRVAAILAECEPKAKGAKVVDSAVLRFPGAVTHFSPGSASNRPRQRSSLPNLFLAGDYVRGVPHGAKGLSQERAYVTGLLAANMVVEALGGGGRPADVIPVEPDEPHVAAGKQAARWARSALEAVGLQQAEY